jgi:hypothetical protein
MKSGGLIESRLRLLEIAKIIARSCGYFATLLPAGESTCQLAPKLCRSWPLVCPGLVSRTNSGWELGAHPSPRALSHGAAG